MGPQRDGSFLFRFSVSFVDWDVALWRDGSSDQSFMVDPLSSFLFHPVLHYWCNKGCGMYYPICGIVHIKEPLLLIRKSSLCSDGSRFPLSLGARCSSVVRVFGHGSMGRRIDPSWLTHWALSCSIQCFTTGVTKAVVCTILSVV